MSAIAPANGSLRQLDGPAQPDQQITAKDVDDQSKLARLFMNLLRDVARLKRRWSPSFIDFRDIVVDASGSKKFNFPHGFKQGVNYWPVRWAGSSAPCLRYDLSSDGSTLVLTSTVAGTVTLRVEIAG